MAFAVVEHDRWNTWLFLWGLALGITGLLHSELMVVLMRRVVPDDAGGTAAQERLHFRRRFNGAMMLTLGAAVGLIAGASDMVWFNVLLTVGALVVWIPAGFVAMRMVRRRKVTAA